MELHSLIQALPRERVYHHPSARKKEDTCCCSGLSQPEKSKTEGVEEQRLGCLTSTIYGMRCEKECPSRYHEVSPWSLSCDDKSWSTSTRTTAGLLGKGCYAHNLRRKTPNELKLRLALQHFEPESVKRLLESRPTYKRVCGAPLMSNDMSDRVNDVLSQSVEFAANLVCVFIVLNRQKHHEVLDGLPRTLASLLENFHECSDSIIANAVRVLALIAAGKQEFESLRLVIDSLLQAIIQSAPKEPASGEKHFLRRIRLL